jgi:hypothetical protein
MNFQQPKVSNNKMQVYNNLNNKIFNMMMKIYNQELMT